MRLSGLMFPLALLGLTAGCDSDDPAKTDIRAIELATVMTTEPRTIFAVQRTDASPVILMEAPRAVGGAECGRRVLLEYSAAVSDTAARPVPLRTAAVYSVASDTIRLMSHEEIMCRRLPLKILSQWRTGSFINFQGSVNYTGSPVAMTLAADISTAADDVMECHAISLSDPEVADKPGVERRFTGSYFTGRLPLRPGQRLRIVP